MLLKTRQYKTKLWGVDPCFKCHNDKWTVIWLSNDENNGHNTNKPFTLCLVSQGVQIAFKIKLKFKILRHNCPISYLCQFWKEFFKWWFVVLNVLNTVKCSSSLVARCDLFWLGLYHSTLTPARMPRLQWDVVMLLLSYVETIFSRDKLLESLHGSGHPPVREINPLKMACGCPCGGVIIKRHVCNLLTLWKGHVNVWLPSSV